jgi:F-type H+-transporting ATPase subunit delta
MNAALQGYLAAVEESLAEQGALADAAAELRGVAELVDAHTELALAINDGSVPIVARRAVLDDLLDGKVRPEVRRLVHQAVTLIPPAELQVSFHWLAARVVDAAARGAGTRLPEDEPVLGRLGSRNRVWGYAAAVLETLPTADLEEVEDQLFRFARTVEASLPLRRALGDRDLPVARRQEVIGDLLGDRVLPATRRLAAYAVQGGRARDILATLDGLVEEAARTRGWRVARVKAADEVDEASRGRMGEALGRLTGAPVELQVAIDPQLLGGVVVQIGDLLVDGTTRHRLDELKEHLLVSGTGPYATPQGREPADG